jgi:PAS domain S-box-containing protein
MKFSKRTDSHLIDDLKKENENLRQQFEDLKAGYDLLQNKNALNAGNIPPTKTGEKVAGNEQLQAVYRESEELFSTIFRVMPIGISLISLSDGLIYDVNQAWLDLTGYSSKDEVVGKNSRELGLIPDANQFNNIIEEFRLRGSVRNAETSFISTEKVKRMVSLNMDMIQIKGEKFVFYTITDISEIKRSEAKIQELLRISERRAAEHHAVIESMPDAVYIGTGNGITQCNLRGLEMLGARSLEDLNFDIGKLGRKFNIRWPDSNIPLSDDELQFTRALKGETVIEEVIGTNAMTGKDIYLRSAVAPVIVNNEIIGAVAINSDITVLKNAQNELKKAKEKAEESDRLKSVFLANISHEIRTPMNGILGFADLLKLPQLSLDSQKKYIEAIDLSGKRMLDIINDLIDISKIDAGQVEARKEQTDIHDLLNELVMFFTPEAENRGIDLRLNVELPSLEFIVETDKTKLAQVITNLIKNALKFTRRDGYIEVGCNLKDLSHLYFYVKDSGIGVARELQDKIFDRFRQGENSKEIEGVGLGLAISKAYVELLGGKIGIDSKAGKGSVFFFTLPFVSHVSRTASSKDDPADIPGTMPCISVLIAEDDEISYVFLRESLRLKNIITYRAKNGQEAVDMVKNQSGINLVLMDIKMPVMGGIEATRLIKEMCPDTPVIIQSAYASQAEIQQTYLAGCDDYMTKPVNINVLFNKIYLYCKF